MWEYSDNEIMELLKSLDTGERNKALTYLYNKLYGSIAQFILANNGNKEDAKDLFQDSLMVFYEHAVRDDFVLSSSIKTYVYAICRNLWYKRLRKASNKEISTENIQDLGLLEQPVDSLELEEKSGRIANLMGQLGEACQKLLLLYYYEEKSLKEIAGHLSLADSNVAKNKKARCMKKLRELIAKLKISKESI